MSHVTSRKCYGPEETSEKCAANALKNGGRGSITEQLLKTRADVTLGGGAKSFNQLAAKSGEWQGKIAEGPGGSTGLPVGKQCG